MHKDAMDCFIKILHTQTSEPNTYIVEWWNLGYTGDPWQVLTTSKISIKPVDEGNWSPITSFRRSCKT